MSARARLIAGSLALLLAGCGYPERQPEPRYVAPPPPNWAGLSGQLKPGMTEANVESLLGPASKTDLSTCGQALGQPWQCKTLHYGNSFNGISVILEQQPVVGWIVNGWRTN